MMGNLNELHVPPNADEATDFAARREFGLRWDSYQQAKLWGMVEGHTWLPRVAREYYRCPDPEQAWIDMLSDAGHSVKR